MGERPARDDWMRRHIKNRSSQQPDGWDFPKDATFPQLATLISDQCLVFRWKLPLDRASLGIGVNTVLLIDLAKGPVVRALLHDVGKQGGLAKDAADFFTNKPELPIPITMACAHLTRKSINLR